MSATVLTLAEAARTLRDATKDKSYRATPLGLEVARYVRWKRNEWGAASGTIRDYEAILAKTASYFADLDLPDFEPPVGQERLRECWDHFWGDRTARTRSKVRSVWVDFFDWACRERGLHGNPARVLAAPKRRDVKRDVFSESFVRKVISSQTYLADRLGCILILEYGLRRAELGGVRFQDFDFERRRLAVTGKGSKVRYVPVVEDAFWRDLGALTLEIQAQPEHHLLYSRKGSNQAGPASRDHTRLVASQTVHRWWYRCLHQAGYVGSDRDKDFRGFNMHRGRHTVATDVLRKTGNIVAAQKLLGHSDIQTTARAYAHFDDSDLARVLESIRQVEVEE